MGERGRTAPPPPRGRSRCPGAGRGEPGLRRGGAGAGPPPPVCCRWFGKCWYVHELLKYEFAIEFDVSGEGVGGGVGAGLRGPAGPLTPVLSRPIPRPRSR